MSNKKCSGISQKATRVGHWLWDHTTVSFPALKFMYYHIDPLGLLESMSRVVLFQYPEYVFETALKALNKQFVSREVIGILLYSINKRWMAVRYKWEAAKYNKCSLFWILSRCWRSEKILETELYQQWKKLLEVSYLYLALFKKNILHFLKKWFIMKREMFRQNAFTCKNTWSYLANYLKANTVWLDLTSLTNVNTVIAFRVDAWDVYIAVFHELLKMPWLNN